MYKLMFIGEFGFENSSRTWTRKPSNSRLYRFRDSSRKSTHNSCQEKDVLRINGISHLMLHRPNLSLKCLS